MFVRAGQVLGKCPQPSRGVGVDVHEFGQHPAFGQTQRSFHGVREALADAVLDHQAVHHHLNGVLELLAQFRGLAQLNQFPVHPGARVAFRGELLEEVHELTLAPPHDGRKNLEAGSFLKLKQLVHNLLWRLTGNNFTADRAVRPPYTRPEKAHVVVNLGDGAHRGAGVLTGGLLVDGDGRREPLDEIDIRLVHLAEELTGIRRQGLNVAPLALGKDRVECKG
jgi:hypothetical protein